MDIRKMVEQDRERGWDVADFTMYDVQGKDTTGKWFTIGSYGDLDSAMVAKNRHVAHWYGVSEDSIELEEISERPDLPIRLIMRHVIEVVL